MDFFWRTAEYLGLAGIAGMLTVLMLGLFLGYAVVGHASLPLLSDKWHREEAFWHSQPARNGYKGILLSDEWLWTWVGWGGYYFIRRLILVLKHEDDHGYDVVFRCEENPNVDSLDDTIHAFSLWIKTARDHDIPAVYRAGRDLYILTDAQMAELDADPVAFLTRFQARIRKRKPLV